MSVSDIVWQSAPDHGSMCWYSPCPYSVRNPLTGKNFTLLVLAPVLPLTGAGKSHSVCATEILISVGVFHAVWGNSSADNFSINVVDMTLRRHGSVSVYSQIFDEIVRSYVSVFRFYGCVYIILATFWRLPGKISYIPFRSILQPLMSKYQFACDGISSVVFINDSKLTESY